MLMPRSASNDEIMFSTPTLLSTVRRNSFVMDAFFNTSLHLLPAVLLWIHLCTEVCGAVFGKSRASALLISGRFQVDGAEAPSMEEQKKVMVQNGQMDRLPAVPRCSAPTIPVSGT